MKKKFILLLPAIICLDAGAVRFTIHSFSPESGAIGTSVTIEGSGFETTAGS